MMMMMMGEERGVVKSTKFCVRGREGGWIKIECSGVFQTAPARISGKGMLQYRLKIVTVFCSPVFFDNEKALFLKVSRLRPLFLEIGTILRWRRAQTTGGIVLTDENLSTRRKVFLSLYHFGHHISQLKWSGTESGPPS